MILLVTDKVEISPDTLVGKIVLQGALADWPAYKHPCRVIQAAEFALTAERLHADYDDSTSTWIFADRSVNDPQIVKRSDIKAICDTADEANLLVAKSREIVNVYNSMKERFANEFEEIAYDQTPVIAGNLNSKQR